MFDTDCDHCYETLTADPLMPDRHCRLLAGEDDDLCIGIKDCINYSIGGKVVQRRGNKLPTGMTPYKLEDFKDYYDPVSKPSHYTEGRKYEPKDVILDWNLNFNLGNAVKYVARAGRKDDILQDLKKARQYLDFEIEYLEKEREKK